MKKSSLSLSLSSLSVTNTVRAVALSLLLLTFFYTSSSTTYSVVDPVRTKVGVSNTNLIQNGLVGHWTFDGKYMTNATATDASGQGNNGTLTNMTTRASAVTGKIGQALSFDGVQARIIIPTKVFSTLTFSFWAKTSTPNQANGVILGDSGAGSGGGNKIGFVTGSIFVQAGGSICNSVTVPTDGKWHHWVISRDGGNNWTIYRDGIQNTSCGSGPGSTNYSLNMLAANGGDNSQLYTGSLDDVRTYNRALTSAEVRSLYKAGSGITIKPSSPNIATIKPSASFTCGVSTVSDVDGNVYNTVSIGAQCWMKQSLRTGTRINVATAQTNNSTIEKYCYSDTAGNCTSNNPNQPDGGLYQWNEAMQYSTTPGARGICPSGWHIPTHDQLTTMERNICTSGSCATDFPYDTSTTGYRGTNEGTKLKPNGTSALEVNLAGFSGSGSFGSRGTAGLLWSSSESGANAWYRVVNSGSAQVGRNAVGKSFGLFVRCLKD